MRSFRAPLGFGIAVMCLCLSPVRGADSDLDAKYDKLADTVINHVVHVKPGQIVQIASGSANMALLEDINADVRAAGGFGVVTVTSDRMFRLSVERAPARYDALPDKAGLALAKAVDYFVNVDYGSDPSAFQDLSAARLNARSKAGNTFVDVLAKRRVPFVEVGNGLYPSDKLAKQYHVTEQQLSDDFWNGVSADYGAIHATAAKVRSAVAGTHTVHVTSPSGTDVTFRIGGESITTSDGTLSTGVAASKSVPFIALPTGDVLFTAVRGSAHGTIAYDPTPYGVNDLIGYTVVLANGKVTAMSAKSGMERLKQFYDTGDAGRDEFTTVDIGVNPGVTAVDGTELIPSIAAGMISLGIGNDLPLGGTNRSNYFFSGTASSATVTIDGKPLITQGKLSL